jgi:tripartite-type tricarboxylate transporter receptor subunit TctC
MRRWLLGLMALCLVAGEATAQVYPSRPITIVVALPAGGAVDSLARVLAEHMRVTLGQPILVENMGGVCTENLNPDVVVMKSAEDGR